MIEFDPVRSHLWEGNDGSSSELLDKRRGPVAKAEEDLSVLLDDVKLWVVERLPVLLDDLMIEK